MHEMALERLIGRAGDDCSCDAAFAIRSANWNTTVARHPLQTHSLQCCFVVVAAAAYYAPHSLQWEVHYAINRVVTSLVGWSRSWIAAKWCVTGHHLLVILEIHWCVFQPPSVTLNLRSGSHFWNLLSETNCGRKFKFGKQLPSSTTSYEKNLSYCWEAAWCFISLKILLSHSRSFKVIQNY